MKCYMAKIDYEYTAKNKLYTEIYEYLKKLNRQVIADHMIPVYKQAVLDTIHSFNAKHPRCKPVKVTWDNSYQKGDFVLRGSGVVTFCMYQGNVI